MAFKNTDQLVRTLIQARLLTHHEIDDFLIASGPEAGRDPDRLLAGLESAGKLTSYQVGRIKSGAADELVLGDYKIVYRNASGSFARVFRAVRLGDGEVVALKVLRKRWADDPRMVAQFRREAELCARLKHKNIVPIHQVFSDRGHHYFTMEFVQGGNLKDFMQIRGKLAPVEATRCVMEIADGLAYALAQGVTHRDLKLTNVLMSTDGVAKLVDFGLGGDEGPAGGSAGGSAGGPDSDGNQRALEYAAIESLPGSRRGDPRSDLFFLGGIYYELLTGQPPWPRTKDRDQRRETARYTEIRPVRSHDPDLPQCVADVCDRLLRADANQRYQSPQAAAADLRRALAELEGRPRPAAAGAAGAVVKTQADQPVVMCIENRPKQRDVLRHYLSKHGFRVVLLSDVERGLVRIGSNPPDCVVLMGDAIGSDMERVYREVVSKHGPAAVAVLSEVQRQLAGALEETPLARVLTQPIRLRDLRETINAALGERNGRSTP